MKLSGQSIPNRNPRVFGQNFGAFLGKAAVLNPVIDAPQHARGVFHGFVTADVRPAGPEIGDVDALIEGRDFKGNARPGGGLLKYQREVFPRRLRGSSPSYLAAIRSAANFKECLIYSDEKLSNLTKLRLRIFKAILPSE